MGRVLNQGEIEQIRERIQKYLRGEIWRDDQDNLLETIDAMQSVVTAAEEFVNSKAVNGFEAYQQLKAALEDLKRKEEAPDAKE